MGCCASVINSRRLWRVFTVSRGLAGSRDVAQQHVAVAKLASALQLQPVGVARVLGERVALAEEDRDEDNPQLVEQVLVERAGGEDGAAEQEHALAGFLLDGGELV